MKQTLSTRFRSLFSQDLLSAIFLLAWPTMLEQLTQTAVQYIDTAMVGSLGTEATAAVGATSTINWLVNGIAAAVGVGFLAYISQVQGATKEARDHSASAREARKHDTPAPEARIASQAVLAVLVLGSMLTMITLSLSSFIPAWMQVEEAIRPLASQYFFILYTPMLARVATIIFGAALRAAGDAKAPMKVGIWVNLINVVLNYLLIYPSRPMSLGPLTFTMPGAGMGVIGAGIASAISFAVGGIMITLALYRHPILSPKGLSLSPDQQILQRCFRVAGPNMLQRFGTTLGFVTFASMVNSLGGISTAAHTIAITVESAFYIPGYGMQAAAATLTGNAYGAGNHHRIKELGKVLFALQISLMFLSGGLLFLFAPGMMQLFSKDAQVIALGATVLRMVALSEPFYGISIIIEGMMNGMGKTTITLLCNIAGMWAIRILGTFLCTQLLGMGLISAWSCMILHNMALFVMLLLYYLSGRWAVKY